MTEEEKETIKIMLEDMFFWQGKSSFITRHRYKELSKKMYKEIEKLQKGIEDIKEYINSPEFLDWNLGFKLIDELEYRKDRINKLLGEENE